MDNHKTENDNIRKVQISEAIDRGELFGGMDKNLKVVEKDFNVDIIQRDNELILKGTHTSEA